MKNLFKVFGIIALAAIIGFSMASCKEPDDSSEPTLTGITAVYTGGSVAINTNVNSLKNNLIVTANYSGNTSKTLDAADYSLSGDLSTSGQKTVTVTYEGKTTSFNVTVSATPIDITYTLARADGEDGVSDTTGIVFTFSASVDSLNLSAADITIGGTAEKDAAELIGTGTSRTLAITVNSAGTATVTIAKTGIEAGTKNLIVFKAGESAPVLTGITAIYTGTAAIYPTTPLNSLKANLTVKAQYTGGGENTLSEHEYSLSGTLTVGTSIVNVTYTDSDGVTKMTSFDVIVTATPTGGDGTPGLAYELIDNGTAYRVRSGDVWSGAVVIPATYEGLPITEIGSLDDTIGSAAFTNLTSIIIPASITTIGNSAFYYYNTNLTTVTFAENSQLKTIGEYAFYNCTSLTNIDIPGGVTFIDENAFLQCTSLTSITLPVTTIGEYAFGSCNNIETVTFIDGSSTTIDDWFRSKSSITAVYIPASVTSIGDGAFGSCTGLTSITLPVTTIGDYVFSDCNNIETVTFIDGPSTTIGDWFRGISSITTINIPASVTSIGEYAFSFCTGLTGITLPVTTIGNFVFYNCNNIETVTFIDGPSTTIGDWFRNKSSITTVNIPASVTTIGDRAFSGCTGLTSVTFAEGLTTIGEYAFSFCTGLISITIPASVTSFGECAFSSCTCLTSVTFAEGLTTIGGSAFSGCTGLINITIPASVISIGWGAFSGSGLTGITIAEGVTSIGNGAFSGCTGLTSIDIPSSVTSIGERAFNGCTGLTNISIHSGITSIGSSAFSGWTASQTIYVENHINQAAADTAWGSGWRSDCNAVIGYVTVTNIEIIRQPDKTEYLFGSHLNITGLEITATYSNGLTIPVTVTASDITGFDSTTAGVKTLTVSYSGKTATFTVTVFNITSFTVTNATEWNGALALLDGATGSFTITIGGSFSVAGSTANTFGTTASGSALSVTLNGSGTLSLNSSGSLLRVAANQTLIIDSENLILQGQSSNTNSLVSVGGRLELRNGKISGNSISGSRVYGGGVNVGGTFIMTGGEISGNTAGAVMPNPIDAPYSYGGGVYVSGTNAIFTMSSGKISGNTANSTAGSAFSNAVAWAYGGGVYVNSGTFTMTGGEISGNRASASSPGNTFVVGGGVYVGANGTFRISNGTIYGSTESNTSLRNTITGVRNQSSTRGEALFSAGISQRGTLYGESWSSSGTLSSTDNTIRVVNGALQ